MPSPTSALARRKGAASAPRAPASPSQRPPSRWGGREGGGGPPGAPPLLEPAPSRAQVATDRQEVEVTRPPGEAQAELTLPPPPPPPRPPPRFPVPLLKARKPGLSPGPPPRRC